MVFKDKHDYLFHHQDICDRCFCCNNNSQRLLIVRHVESRKLVHLCADCMCEKKDDYLLDNTRPWLGKDPP